MCSRNADISPRIFIPRSGVTMSQSHLERFATTSSESLQMVEARTEAISALERPPAFLKKTVFRRSAIQLLRPLADEEFVHVARGVARGHQFETRGLDPGSDVRGGSGAAGNQLQYLTRPHRVEQLLCLYDRAGTGNAPDVENGVRLDFRTVPPPQVIAGALSFAFLRAQQFVVGVLDPCAEVVEGSGAIRDEHQHLPGFES